MITGDLHAILLAVFLCMLLGIAVEHAVKDIVAGVRNLRARKKPQEAPTGEPPARTTINPFPFMLTTNENLLGAGAVPELAPIYVRALMCLLHDQNPGDPRYSRLRIVREGVWFCNDTLDKTNGIAKAKIFVAPARDFPVTDPLGPTPQLAAGGSWVQVWEDGVWRIPQGTIQTQVIGLYNIMLQETRKRVEEKAKDFERRRRELERAWGPKGPE
jgi:hypothetical protein